MNIIAVDDEELALEGLLDAIRQAAPEAEVHGFSYPEDALAFADGHPCAVAFLCCIPMRWGDLRNNGRTACLGRGCSWLLFSASCFS